MSYTILQFRPSVANIRDRTRFVLVWSYAKGKLPVQSLVPSLSLNNLRPLTSVFPLSYLSPLKQKLISPC